MKAADVKKYFEYLAKQSGLPDDGLSTHVDRCIALGLKDMWYAKNWKFRVRAYSLSITSQADSYVLPDDFEQALSVRETESVAGKQLWYLAREDFERIYPKQSTFTAGNPLSYTIYYNKPDRKFYIKIVPYPTDQTIYMDILTAVPSSVDQLPEKASACLHASVTKYLYKLGSQEHAQAYVTYMDEVHRLETIDSPYGGGLTKILDSSDTEVQANRSWEK